MATVAEISCVHVQADRRAALLGLAAVPAMLSAKPAEAAYGDAANVFGKTVNTSGALARGSARDVSSFYVKAFPTKSCLGSMHRDAFAARSFSW